MGVQYLHACNARQQGVKSLRGRVQCVGEGRASSLFEGIALADLRLWGGLAAMGAAGLAVEAAPALISAS